MKPVTLGVIVGNRGFFPGHLARPAARPCSRCWRRKASRRRPRRAGHPLRQRREPGRRAEVRRPVQGAPRRDRRHAGHPAQLRRRARHRQRHALGRAGRAGAGARLPRRCRQDDRRPTAATRSAARCRSATTCASMASRTRSPPAHRGSESASFRADLRHFVGTCRVVRGLRNARIGAIGARPAAFNTVRYSEKLLERAGITVETLDLSEIFGRAGRLNDADAECQGQARRDQGLHAHRGHPRPRRSSRWPSSAW